MTADVETGILVNNVLVRLRFRITVIKSHNNEIWLLGASS